MQHRHTVVGTVLHSNWIIYRTNLYPYTCGCVRACVSQVSKLSERIESIKSKERERAMESMQKSNKCSCQISYTTYMYRVIRNTPTLKQRNEERETVSEWVNVVHNCPIGYATKRLRCEYENFNVCENEWTICAQRRRTRMSHCALKPFVIFYRYINVYVYSYIHARARKKKTMSICSILTHTNTGAYSPFMNFLFRVLFQLWQ